VVWRRTIPWVEAICEGVRRGAFPGGPPERGQAVNNGKPGLTNGLQNMTAFSNNSP